MHDLKFIGAMIDGYANDPNLDHPDVAVTPSGMCSPEPRSCMLAALGRNPVMRGADFRLGATEDAAHVIDSVPIAEGPRADFGVDNAKTYLGL